MVESWLAGKESSVSSLSPSIHTLLLVDWLWERLVDAGESVTPLTFHQLGLDGLIHNNPRVFHPVLPGKNQRHRGFYPVADND